MARYTSIRGLQIKAEVAGLGLEKDASGNLQVKVDDSSIEIATDTLQIKASGITNDMLAGSIADGKLVETYIKSSEVDGTTIEFDSSTLNIVSGGVDTTQLADDAVEVAKLAINNAEADGKVLAWNVAGYMEWVDQAVGEGYIEESGLLKEDESANCDSIEVDFVLASAPVENSVQVFLNGSLMSEGSGKDYTFTGSTVTFNVAPDTGDALVIYYIAT